MWISLKIEKLLIAIIINDAGFHMKERMSSNNIIVRNNQCAAQNANDDV